MRQDEFLCTVARYGPQSVASGTWLARCSNVVVTIYRETIVGVFEGLLYYQLFY